MSFRTRVLSHAAARLPATRSVSDSGDKPARYVSAYPVISGYSYERRLPARSTQATNAPLELWAAPEQIHARRPAAAEPPGPRSAAGVRAGFGCVLIENVDDRSGGLAVAVEIGRLGHSCGQSMVGEKAPRPGHDRAPVGAG